MKQNIRKLIDSPTRSYFSNREGSASPISKSRCIAHLSIQASLQTVNWKERWKGCTVGEMWTDLRETLTSLVALHITLKKDEKGKRKRLPNQIRKKISERSEAWCKYRQYRGFRKKFRQVQTVKKNEVNNAIAYGRKKIREESGSFNVLYTQ